MQINDSDRLRFRLMDKNDGDLLYELDQDPEVMRFINGGKPSTMVDIEERFIPRLETFTDPSKGCGLWKIEEKKTEAFIGWILVRPMYFFVPGKVLSDNFELGWRLLRRAWGKGYGTEAARHVMHAISDNTNIKKFTAIADPENHASTNIMKKLGMRFLRQEPFDEPALGLSGEVVVYGVEYASEPTY